MWEEISTADLQTELQVLFASNECLQTPPARLLEKISPFLTASVKSDAEQASAKHAICDLFGLVTQKCDRGRSSLEQGMQFQHDVEVSSKQQSLSPSSLPLSIFSRRCCWRLIIPSFAAWLGALQNAAGQI